jgi:hypothetical protein
MPGEEENSPQGPVSGWPNLSDTDLSAGDLRPPCPGRGTPNTFHYRRGPNGLNVATDGRRIRPGTDPGTTSEGRSVRLRPDARPSH